MTINNVSEPVAAPEPHEPEDEHRIAEGIALCLSGGGYRAMLFHLGALWRLNEVGYLKKLSRVSSVSGGSITAGVLGYNWHRLAFDQAGIGTNFERAVLNPIRKLASTTIDVGSVLLGVVLPGSVSERVRESYDETLFEGASLQDLPAEGTGPRFVINATNLQSGVLWRFSRPYMADYKVGRVIEPTTSLAAAVAASSAFPPVLSPAVIEVGPEEWDPDSKGWSLSDLQSTGKVVLSDGGVYDNLGLETAWKRYDTLLVSDGGGTLSSARSVPRDWARHSVRVLQVIDNQVRSLRKRQLIGALASGSRSGTYWGIRSEVADYGLADALDCDPRKTSRLASISTRLAKLSNRDQEELINWGFAICDTALRRWVDGDLARPTDLPYPKRSLA